jgi:hypothetical protein
MVVKMSAFSFVNNTESSGFISGCSTGTLVGAAGVGAIALVGVGGLCYLGSLAKRGIVRLAHKVDQFRQAYQFRNDIVLATNFVTAGGAWLATTTGMSHPYLSLAVAGATAAADIAMLRYASSTRSLDPVGSAPIVIDASSSIHLDAETCLFTLPRNKISCHSVGAALELMKTTTAYQTAHRQDLENLTAQEIRQYFAQHAPLITDMVAHFDFGGAAKSLFDLKYGIGAARLTEQQLSNRVALIETMGDDKEHPRQLRHCIIPGVPLSEAQLSGWLMDIRQQVYTESQQSTEAPAAVPQHAQDQ